MSISKVVSFFNWTLGGLLFLSTLLCQHIDVHRGLEFVFNDKDIHLSLGVVRGKVGDLLLNMFSTF
jgi:hypothetical protein